MRFAGMLGAVALWGLGACGTAAELAYNENFSVLAPDRELADAVLARAEQFRRDVACQWLGQELPASWGKVAISVAVCSSEDVGLTLLKDHGRRTCHWMWLRTDRQRATGSTLHHEVTHTVLGTYYADRLPAWADEGAASLQDDADRAALHREVVDSLALGRPGPELRTILDAPSIGTTDQTTYGVCTSLVEFFLARGDGPTLLHFAAAGKAAGWDQALEQFYGIATVSDLQTAWLGWLRGTLPAARAMDSAAGTSRGARGVRQADAPRDW